MKERPILFSGRMVRAILEGRKTQTRRVVTVPWHKGRRCQPYEPWWPVEDGKLFRVDEAGDAYEHWQYGTAGDQLWVRETFTRYDNSTPVTDRDAVWYRADGSSAMFGTGPIHRKLYGRARMPKKEYDDLRWTPAIFLPRWASRLLLEITAVRVERLQDITRSDILSEGITEGDGIHAGSLRRAWIDGWNEINGSRGYGWESNPWVWKISFKEV